MALKTLITIDLTDNFFVQNIYFLCEFTESAAYMYLIFIKHFIVLLNFQTERSWRKFSDLFFDIFLCLVKGFYPF